eukprot:CAMPEP_0178407470 /NCGR_PEP_ID=MMETSP0689_2-20121128/19446_1 /TAXON_ID=160604 /ORGANISM="Amphidinium massartii, Strain CS-259" /LENGTH=58 /DNA_ID=CAMNT_0020028547 /DNA_START=88 /DNA_END=264 /DNA_ORIENTATION=+
MSRPACTPATLLQSLRLSAFSSACRSTSTSSWMALLSASGLVIGVNDPTSSLESPVSS